MSEKISEREYLGDSTNARLEGTVVYLEREFSTGRKIEVRLDPLVLGEFIAWLEANNLLNPTTLPVEVPSDAY